MKSILIGVFLASQVILITARQLPSRDVQPTIILDDLVHLRKEANLISERYEFLDRAVRTFGYEEFDDRIDKKISAIYEGIIQISLIENRIRSHLDNAPESTCISELIESVNNQITNIGNDFNTCINTAIEVSRKYVHAVTDVMETARSNSVLFESVPISGISNVNIFTNRDLFKPVVLSLIEEKENDINLDEEINRVFEELTEKFIENNALLEQCITSTVDNFDNISNEVLESITSCVDVESLID